MATSNAFTADVIARLRDFFAPGSHWQRRLWNVGLVLGIGEIIEASEAVRLRALSQESLAWLADRLRRNVAPDVGAGDQIHRTALMECLKRDMSASGVNHYMLKEIAADIEANYLSRWADHLRTSDNPPGRERTSRALAAHLLDAGFGLTHLSRWLEEMVESADDTFDTADIFQAAAKLLGTPLSRYEVLVLFEVEPSRNATRPTEWITSGAASAWLREKGFDAVRLRQRGGLLLQVDARDEEGAVSLVADKVDRFVARVTVGTSTPFVIYPDLYLAGGNAVPRTRPRRNVRVHALARADRVYDLEQAAPIDSALELLSHLDTGPPPVAVGAGWSAIEALLSGPGDKAKVAAADRLAALVACSWPRAELTDLAWAKIAQNDDPLCAELLTHRSNRDKARRIAEELRPGRRCSFDDASDQAASRRISKLFANPSAVLNDVRAHAEESFRRLYRVRNLILHAALTNPVALDATLRTAPPLVGAGMDRVTHSYFVSGRLPLELAARAELEVARAGAEGLPGMTDLLE